MKVILALWILYAASITKDKDDVAAPFEWVFETEAQCEAAGKKLDQERPHNRSWRWFCIEGTEF
jgi:hypothetical protein